ncbi:MAG: diacylglycerol kinase family protein [Candidatus Sumerlaeia bacterium]|nr:diacylglycerol kinase family protein [Candidatus Sumerlaeia bacterium]
MRRRGFHRALADALRGIRDAARAERHMRVHLLAALCAVAAGVALGLPRLEWAVLAIACALVIALELVNTAVERAVDLACPRRDPRARLAKDAAAGAVLVAAAAAVVVGAALFLPRLLGRF